MGVTQTTAAHTIIITTSSDDTMNLDCYTQYIPLTSKARFWGNFVSALKGSNDLYASPVPHVRTYYPSIVEALPQGELKLKHEFGKLEKQTWDLPPSYSSPSRGQRQDPHSGLQLLSSPH